MSKSSIFWSSFLLSLGIFFLLDLVPNYTYPFELNFKLFPLLFVFIGILILKPKKIVAYFMIVLIAILLSSSVFSIKKYCERHWLPRWEMFHHNYDNL